MQALLLRVRVQHVAARGCTTVGCPTALRLDCAHLVCHAILTGGTACASRLVNMGVWGRSWAAPLPARALNEIALQLVLAMGVRELVVDSRYVPSPSMEPTFARGDYFILDKLSIRTRPLERGDVICFSPPPALAAGTPAAGCIIKRVVGVGGDVVLVRGGRLFVNGVCVDEPYVTRPAKYTMAAVTVPAGELFVLGDNRNESHDSHAWGCLPRKLVLGRPLCTHWPPRRACGRRSYASAHSPRGTLYGLLSAQAS